MVIPSKRDWKLFREKIGDWQEHYMERLVHDGVITMEDLEEFSEDAKEAVALILNNDFEQVKGRENLI